MQANQQHNAKRQKREEEERQWKNGIFPVIVSVTVVGTTYKFVQMKEMFDYQFILEAGLRWNVLEILLHLRLLPRLIDKPYFVRSVRARRHFIELTDSLVRESLAEHLKGATLHIIVFADSQDLASHVSHSLVSVDQQLLQAEVPRLHPTQQNSVQLLEEIDLFERLSRSE